MANYARHDRVLEAAAKRGGWKNCMTSGGGYGTTSVDRFLSEEAAESHFSGDSRQGLVLEIFYNAGGYTIGVNLKRGVCGKTIASTGNLKDRKAKERLAIAEKFIIDHPLEGAAA